MTGIRRRRIADAVWVPLRVSEYIEKAGNYGYEGYKEEFFGLGSIATLLNNRFQVDKLGWSEIGIGHNQGVYATKEWYKPADVYQYYDGVDLGIELVLVQNFPGEEPPEWHLNQDLVMALGLLREGDEWVRPAEGYTLVARLRRNNERRPVAIEIKNEFIRDYLAARQMALRLTSYRKRDSIAATADHITWPEGGLQEKSARDRFEARVIPILEGGHPAGDFSYAVFRISRTDVDADEDVPRPGPETDANTASEQWTGVHEGKPLFRVMGERWSDEWIERAPNSIRVRGDKVPTGIHYMVDASGTRAPSEDLENEDDPRWLWFRPEVVLALIRRRGGSLEWYTQDTGGVTCSPGYSVHFGINSADLITVDACDIAKLPTWQQQLWAGFNTAPEGGVSKELLSAQMSTVVADTRSPEGVLPEVLEYLDEAFIRRIGAPLFRKHPSTGELLCLAHRFRAVEAGGFLALAKDLVRLTVDRIDGNALQKVVPPPAKEKWGSLRSLEKYLGTLVSETKAHAMMAPLFGAYDLRLRDAHLPPADLQEAYCRVRVDKTFSDLQQGFRLMASVVSGLAQIEYAVRV